MEGGAADIGKVIVGNGPLFDFGMGASSINTKLRPIALTYMVTKLAAPSLTNVQQSPTENSKCSSELCRYLLAPTCLLGYLPDLQCFWSFNF